MPWQGFNMDRSIQGQGHLFTGIETQNKDELTG